MEDYSQRAYNCNPEYTTPKEPNSDSVSFDFPAAAPVHDSPIEWTFDTESPATPLEPAQKGRCYSSKQSAAEVNLKKFLAEKAFTCRQGKNGSFETLSVITGTFHSFCGTSKVAPQLFVQILTEWGTTLPEPWRVEKECHAADSWWRKFAIASLDIFASLITGTRREDRKLGGSRESQMYRTVSLVELWHYLHFHDPAATYWRNHAICRERQKTAHNEFEALRRELAVNSTRLNSFLRETLNAYFREPFENIQKIPLRRDRLEERIVNLENRKPLTDVGLCSSPVGSVQFPSSLPIVPPPLAVNGLIRPQTLTPPQIKIATTDRKQEVEEAEITQQFKEQQYKEQTEEKADNPITRILEWTNRPPWNIIHDEYGIEYVGSNEFPTRHPDGSLNLTHPDVFAHVLTSSFLPIRDYPISFFTPARWSDKTLQIQPGATAALQGFSKSSSSLFKTFIQKEFRYTVCAVPLSRAVEMIKKDELLKSQTAELREQVRIEQEWFGDDRVENAEEWQKSILCGQIDRDKKITEERQRYRKLAECLPENIKCGLPTIMPSGWAIPHDHCVNGHFIENDRKVSDEAMIPNGIVCVDLDWLGDRLPVVRKRLIESGLCSLVATSARGTGLYMMVRYDKNRYRGIAGFHAAREAVWDAVKQMGLKPDPQCREIIRRRFLAHDSDVWVDESDTAKLPDPALISKPNFCFDTSRLLPPF